MIRLGLVSGLRNLRLVRDMGGAPGLWLVKKARQYAADNRVLLARQKKKKRTGQSDSLDKESIQSTLDRAYTRFQFFLFV